MQREGEVNTGASLLASLAARVQRARAGGAAPDGRG